MIKLEKGDFSFTIDDSNFVPEKLLTLKPKTHKSGLILLIEKNIFISRESKELAEEAVNNMEIGNRQKSCANKRCKIGKQMLIETAFAKAMDNNHILVMMRMKLYRIFLNTVLFTHPFIPFLILYANTKFIESFL